MIVLFGENVNSNFKNRVRGGVFTSISILFFSISFPCLHPRILIMHDLFQYLSAIHSECIHYKVDHPFLVFRQGILRSFQKREPRVFDRIIFEIPEQIIHLGINRTMHPRPAILFKDRLSIQLFSIFFLKLYPLHIIINIKKEKQPPTKWLASNDITKKVTRRPRQEWLFYFRLLFLSM